MSENVSVDVVKSQAKTLPMRTIFQGAVATVLVAVLPLVYTAVQGGVQFTNWSTLGNSALTAGLMAAISFVMAIYRPVALNTETVVEPVVVQKDGAEG